MARKVIILLSLLLNIFGGLTSCTSAHCKRQEVIPPVPGQKNIITNNHEYKNHIFVYKYDGSLQCDRSKAIPIEQMQKELVNIKVYSRANKPDGLMHIQVCGSPTGRANVYEIHKSNKEKAENRGFRVWSFN